MLYEVITRLRRCGSRCDRDRADATGLPPAGCAELHYYAAEAVIYCQERGIEVPGRVSVTGFDDNLFARLVRPRLTTVYQDAFLRGHQAVTMLLALMRGETLETPSVRSPVSLKIRESVGRVPE